MKNQADRDRMIAETIRAGVPRDHASEIVDLGAHAFDQAFDAARRIIDTACTCNRPAILASVFASFVTLMRETMPEHWEALIKANPSGGASTVIIAPDLSKEAVR